MSTRIDLSRHSSYSDPGRHAGLLDAVPTDLPGLSAVARNVIVHYRTFSSDLPATTRDDIHLRWLSAILDVDQSRHDRPLAGPRELASRVQGCCRDHTLFCVGALRQHGIAARSRIGFADYFAPDFHHDHVVVETWQAGRWVRFDPEVEAPRDGIPTPMDIPAGPGAPFQTAAEVWQGYRSGAVDPSRFGVEPGTDLSGPWFIQCYVLMELAHRQGDELLLWDGWGAMSQPGALDAAEVALADEVAALLVAADGGDDGAEAELGRRYAADVRLHPGPQVLRQSPFGGPPQRDEVGPRHIAVGSTTTAVTN
ncbi:MAG: transglutaminase domain-containing protein [Nocardioidaceae bacterium]